jgi:hypothetical protein
MSHLQEQTQPILTVTHPLPVSHGHADELHRFGDECAAIYPQERKRMKQLSLALIALALCLVPPTLACAQDAAKPDRAQSDPVKYDTVMEKRADLRVKYQRAVRDAAKQATAPVVPDTNDSRVRLRRAHVNDNYMVDFMARSAKRADLRARITQVGMERAYQEWLHQGHGH